jgi:rare lipoprotein A
MYKNIIYHWGTRLTLILLLVITGCSLSRPKKKKIDENPGYYYIEPFNPDKKKTVTEVEEPKKIVLPAEPKKDEVRTTTTNVELGKASYYGDKFQGRPTANGELYDRNKLTAAHKTLPFGTMCKVTNIANGKSVVVKVNDRGPFTPGRVIDLSYKAFTMIGGIGSGVIEVKVEVVK